MVPDPITDVWRYLRERWRDERSTSSRSFDARLGVHTARWTLAGYEPTPVATGLAVLEALPVSAPGATFVDIGCGKGRMLLLAARWPFRRVVGFDHDAALVRQAQRNLRDSRDPQRRCHQLQAVQLDARAIPWPLGRLVLFMYNPFPAAIVDEVIASVERSLRAQPRPCALAYVNPLHAEILDDRGWRLCCEGGQATGRWGWWLPPRARASEPIG